MVESGKAKCPICRNALPEFNNIVTNITIEPTEWGVLDKLVTLGWNLKYVNSETIRLLQCSQCLSSENKKKVYRTCDANSAVNMKNLFKILL